MLYSPNGQPLSTNQADILINNIRTNATLRHEEWQLIDDELQVIARQRLNAVSDIVSAGLVRSLGGLGVMISAFERSTDMTPAEINMDGATESQQDRPEYDLVGVPVPIFSKAFQFNRRQLEASRQRGETLDVTTTGIATRKVADQLEDMIFNGTPKLKVDGKTIYGYTTHPNRLTTTLSGTGWAVESGRDIIGDTRAMLDAAYAVDRFGPFIMYVAKNVWAAVQEDYSTLKGDRTFKERIEAFVDIQAVRPGDSLDTNEVVLVQMTRDNLDLAIGADIQSMETEVKGMISFFNVFAAMALRLKADSNNSLGVVHGSV